jgi:hypothetical protein
MTSFFRISEVWNRKYFLFEIVENSVRIYSDIFFLEEVKKNGISYY